MWLLGRGPMAMERLRFDGAPPSHDELIRRLRESMGERLFRAVDEVELVDGSTDGSVAQVLSQDRIALTYARSVLVQLGAESIDGEPARVSLPRWTTTPWPEHGWWTRWQIRLGRAD